MIAAAAQFAAASLSVESGKPEVPLRWRPGKISVALSGSLNESSAAIRAGSDVDAALARALDRWARATGLEFSVKASERTSVSPAGTHGDGISLITIAPTEANLAIFAGNLRDTPATTRIFFNRQGYITEADIVLNPYQTFSTDGTFGTFDLESVLVHELGHLIGLEHSSMWGSAMYRHLAKNGLYSADVFWQRALSQADLAAVRVLYGSLDPECCVSISGVNGTTNEQLVWAEDADTGSVMSATTVLPGAKFVLGGLEPGSYRVYGGDDTALADLKTSSASLSFRIRNSVPAAGEHLGLNGQLAKMPVRVTAGGTFTIYLSGADLDDRAKIDFTSPYLFVTPGSVRLQDYGKDIRVVSFEVVVSEDAPPGRFTLRITGPGGPPSYLPGAVIVAES